MVDTDRDIDLDLTTESEVAMQGGTAPESMIADHAKGELAKAPQVAITQRGLNLVSGYRDDIRHARVVASAPPSMRELIDQIWHHPNVLADSGLLRFATRLSGLFIIPFVALLYLLIAAQVKPAVALVVDSILVALIVMWVRS